MSAYFITEWEEYQYCTKRGFQPLLDTINFKIDIHLRVEIQRKIFGVGVVDIAISNSRFYRWVWKYKPHYCEETMKPLHDYSSVFCSHILSRGAYPEIAHDPRNTNILSFESHQDWENGDRKKMRIYPKNIRMIELLKSEYEKLLI